jgi:PAS domain S-box-containing protein
MSRKLPLLVRPVNENFIASYYLLSDLEHRPVVILRTGVWRDIYQHSVQIRNYLVWSLLVSGFVFSIAMLFLVERSVLSRLGEMGSRVNEIRSSGRITQRIRVDGGDELTDLMLDVNTMLDALEKGQQQLKRNENLYRQMAMNASDALYVMPLNEPQQRAVQWYGPVDEMLGYEPDGWSRSLAAWEEALHPDDRERVVQARQHAAQSGTSFQEEYRIRCQDGTYRFWLERGRRLDCHGAGLEDGPQFIGACTDITERMRAEQELREREEQEKRIAALTRGVLSATDELLSCQTTDQMLRRGVELAREKLGIERCSIALTSHEDSHLISTYGTNSQGQTTDERGYRFMKQDWLWTHPRLAQPGSSGWVSFEQEKLYEWDGEKTAFIGNGWICATLIQGLGGLKGVLFNDAALSSHALDPIQQEVLAVYCSVLGNLLEHKQTELQLQQVVRGARCLLWQALVVQGEDDFLWETNILNHEAAQEFLPLHIPPGGTYSDGFYLAKLEEERSTINALARQALRTGQAAYKQEYRLRLHNDEVRWISEDVRIESQGGGRWILTGICTDITEHKQLHATRRALLSRLVEAQEEERQRIARELHDVVGQDLAVLLLRLKSLPEQAPLALPVAHSLQEIEKLTRHLIQQSRRLALDLRPETLDKLGLPTALRRYTQEWSHHSGVPVDFHSQGLNHHRLPPDMETTIYRVAQEALSNVLRHAQARRVSVLLERHALQVVLLIEDDGRGFVVETALNLPLPERRLGLVGMYERVSLVNGTLKVESHPGQGTTLVARIPLPETAPDYDGGLADENADHHMLQLLNHK